MGVTMILTSLHSYNLQAEKGMKLLVSHAVQDYVNDTGSSIGDARS